MVVYLSSSLYASEADTQLLGRRTLLSFLPFPLHMQDLIAINAIQGVKHSICLCLHSFTQW